jgi:hypothetical protein
MSATPHDIIQSFDVLPEADQRVVAVEIFRRAAQWDSTPLTDDDLSKSADELFQALDRREEEDAHAQSS